MADIIEAIHKINYEVNDEQLQRATTVLRLQINELNTLNATLGTFRTELAKVHASETARLEDLNRKIDETTRKIEANTNKAHGFFSQLSTGLLKAFGGDGEMGKVIGNFVDKGITKIGDLRDKGKTSFADLAKGVLSFSGVVPLAISVVISLAEELLSASENAKDLNGEMKTTSERAKNIGAEAAGELSGLVKLKATIEDTSVAYDKRLTAVKDLQDQYPGYFNNLSREEILAGKVADAYQKVVTAIIAGAKARVLDKELEKELAKLIEAQREIKRLAAEGSISLDVKKDAVTGLEDIALTSRQLDDALKVKQNVSKSDALSNNNKGKVPLEAFDNQPAIKKLPAGLQENIIKYRVELFSIRDLILEINENNKLLPGSDAGGYKGGSSRSSDTANSKVINVSAPGLPGSDYGKEYIPAELLTQETETEYSKDLRLGVEKRKKEKEAAKKKEEEEAEAQARRRENIKKTIDAYQELSTAAVKAITTIYEAQIKALEGEIAMREKRVEEARKLAERGNTDALKLEEERLAEAQKKKEAYARKEATLNAALAFSNSLVAVTGAIANAVKGDPYSAPARIVAAVAAVVAALASGYAFVQSFKTDAFADGVIDYRGKGGPRDDANWVRISSGESVITANGTQQNRAILEAINNGAQLKMIDPSLPFVMPAFVMPSVIGGSSYASRQDLRTLETKLDDVVYAIEGNRLKQNIFFNEQGVGIMTERAMAKNRKRWS